METLEISTKKQNSYREDKNTVHISSSFAFLNAHRGLRPSKVHVLLGTSGGGKSTLLRSILKTITEKNKLVNVLVWLSEESVDDFNSEFSKVDMIASERKRIHVFSEVDNMTLDSKALLLKMETLVANLVPTVIVYDNLTTSALYMGKNVAAQEWFAKRLKKLALDSGAATLVVAHTDGKVNDNIGRTIDQNDIRGNKTIVNLAEFFYVLQRFKIGEHFFPTLRITKHRGQNITSSMFLLRYDGKTSLYSGDVALTFEEFKAAYVKRNVL